MEEALRGDEERREQIGEGERGGGGIPCLKFKP